MDSIFPQLRFYIISGKPKDPREIELHNKAFSFWKNNWDSIYNGELKIDEFFRQDAMSMIMDKDQIIALHLYTSFNTNLQSHLEHSYFCAFTDKFKNTLADQKIMNVTSAEYMTVAKEYRSKGANIARALLYLSLNVFKYHGKEVMIAPMDIKQGVSYIVQEAGATVIDSNVRYKNFLVDLGMIIPAKANRPPESIEKMVSNLWNTRTDFSDWSDLQDAGLKRAA